jgi:hypothetical protein
MFWNTQPSQGVGKRGVAQPGQRACFGYRRSWVRIPPPRPMAFGARSELGVSCACGRTTLRSTTPEGQRSWRAQLPAANDVSAARSHTGQRRRKEFHQASVQITPTITTQNGADIARAFAIPTTGRRDESSTTDPPLNQLKRHQIYHRGSLLWLVCNHNPPKNSGPHDNDVLLAQVAGAVPVNR